MEKISRYILVAVALITSAVVLPQLYWMAFDKPIPSPLVNYSCTDDCFMILNAQSGKVEFSDSRGNIYEKREDYEKRLPLLYARQLLVSGTMPDTLRGIAIDMHDLNRANSNIRYKPEEQFGPQPELFPLFEAESGRANLEMPEDYFRITWRIEFINAATNKIDEEKSQMFSAALYKKGFQFPSKHIAGIPTTRKSCDEGYFIIDSADQLYQLKMMQGVPFVVKIEKPEELKFQYIKCCDLRDKKYYAYLFTDKNEIYILTQDVYELVKIPVEGFDQTTCSLRISGDMFNYNYLIQSEDNLKVVALNYNDYSVVDTYEKSWLKRSERKAGLIAAAIFPVQVRMSDRNSNFTNFFIDRSAGFLWIIVNLVFVAIHFLLLVRRKARLKKHILDLLVVTITGIYGFIAVNFFQNKFFD